MYQALYRKWRPRTFSDVVGQNHITETLRRQIAQNRPSHAYLFTGTRGTGKTTCAKILAKAVNCQNPVNGDPCNQCPICRGIDTGSILDVTELDAASNNGVDSVRALRDEAIYAPASAKYRVYIVDEVHMLSTSAFNAFLKILEEPPAHLLFILATTELHKVPATILSRCQRFSFKRILPRDIRNRLLYVAGQEGISLTEDAADLLSRLSDGALRDALSLLDQCAAAGGEVDISRVQDILGLSGRLQTVQLMEHLLNRDVPSALILFNQLYAGGKDVAALLGELAALLRDLLLNACAPQGGEALLSGGYDAATLRRLAQAASPVRLLHMTSLVQRTAADLPLSVNRRTDGELCLIRLCDESLSGDLTALTARVERLEKNGGFSQPVPTRKQPGISKTPSMALQSARNGNAVAGPDSPSWEDSPPPWGEPVCAPSARNGNAVAGPDSPSWEDSPPPRGEPACAPSARNGNAVAGPDSPSWEDSPPPWGEPTACVPSAQNGNAVAGNPDPPSWEDSPPPYGERLTKAPPAPPQTAASPSKEGASLWQTLLERCQPQISPLPRSSLGDAYGTLEGNVLIVRCNDDWTMENLNCAEVEKAFAAAASECLGRSITVRFAVGDGTKPDRLEDLILRGKQYDSFHLV